MRSYCPVCVAISPSASLTCSPTPTAHQPLTLAAALPPTLPRITRLAYPHKDWNNAVEDWDRHHRHHGSTEVGGLPSFSSQLEGDDMEEMRKGQWAIRELEWQRHQRQEGGGGGDRPDEAKEWRGATNSVASHGSFLSYSPAITPVSGGVEIGKSWMGGREVTAGETGGSEIQLGALRRKDLRSTRIKLHAFLHADDDAPYPRAAKYVSLVYRNRKEPVPRGVIRRSHSLCSFPPTF